MIIEDIMCVMCTISITHEMMKKMMRKKRRKKKEEMTVMKDLYIHTTEV